MIAALPLAVLFAHDERGRILHWSAGCEELFGYPAVEAVGRTVDELLRPVLPQPREELFRQVRETGRWRGEAVYHRRDGAAVPVASVWLLHRDAGGAAAVVQQCHDLTAHKRTEAASQEANERLNLALEAAGAVNSGWDVQANRVDDWSPAYRDLYGIGPDEPPSTDGWARCVHPDDRESVQARVAEILASPGDDVLRVEFRILHPQRGERWLAGLGKCTRDAAGRPLRLVGINLDITDRKHAELQLRESDEWFRQLAENLREVFWLTNAGMDRLLYISPAYETVWGRSCASLYANPWAFLEAIHPDDRSWVEREVDRSRQDGRFDHEYRVVRPDGSVRWVWDRGFAIRDRNGQFYRFAGIAQDVTERKQAERDLEQRNALLQSVLDSMAEGVIVADEQGALVHFNRAAEQMHGMGRQPVGPAEWAERYGLFLPDGATPLPADQAPLVRAVNGEVVEGVDLFVKTAAMADGKWITVSGRPLRGQDGARRGGVIVIRDVTERRRAEEKLKESAAQLQTLSRRLLGIQEEERRALARELHDDLGQALTGLKLMLERAPRQPSPDREATYDAARRLVQDLMARVRGLSMHLRPTLLDDLGLLPAVRWLAQQYSEQTGVQATVEQDGLDGRRLPAAVETAAYRIVQEALTNVARHAHVAQAAVVLRQSGGRLTLVVEDRGCGFHPAAATASGGIPGMRERATLLGGSLDVRSGPGTGTRVVAVLPLDGPAG